MAELTPEQIAVNEATALAETKAAELIKQNKIEARRDLSKELGINAFEPSELKAKFDEFTKWQTDHKTEQEKLQGTVDAYKLKETAWDNERIEFNSKLKASELGIPADKLEDALRLAGGDPSKLDEVIKKYPIFQSKDGIKIGVTRPDNSNQLDGKTEVEKYAEKFKNNPYYNATPSK